MKHKQLSEQYEVHNADFWKLHVPVREKNAIPYPAVVSQAWSQSPRDSRILRPQYRGNTVNIATVSLFISQRNAQNPFDTFPRSSP